MSDLRMSIFRRFVLALALLTFTLSTSAQENKPLPFDPNVKTGTLKNGIKYFILPNKKPEKRAELRLIVNAGSVLEDDDQLGLAHFTEHMAFNGSKNFKKNDLIDYLETIGVKFGPELNAYTGFDETVYMLQVPTDKKEIMEKAFLVLEDWAFNLSFDTTEVEKERGVIIEEWRLGRGAESRMQDKQLPVLFQNSRYAERLPIGQKKVIESFDQKVLKRFYRDWYRPDLMAVAAVGDFETADIERLIKVHFDKAPVVKTQRERKYFDVPKHKETLYAIATDKEATRSSVTIYFKQDAEVQKTEGDFKKTIMQYLFSSMLNERFNELSKLPDPPFAYAYTGKARYVRTSELLYLAAFVKDGGIEKGLETIFREAERVRKFGFTVTELERVKKNILRSLEQQLKEKDKTESGRLIGQFVSYYLDGEPVPGIENEYALYQKYLPAISVKDVNNLAAGLLRTDNRVMFVNAPEKAGIKIPNEAELSGVIQTVQNENITAYVDKVTDRPLLSEKPVQGKIVASSVNRQLGTAEWKLSNGVRVFIKPTDFKNDEVVFNAFMPGGLSLASEKEFRSAAFSADIARESGVGEFTQTELQKMMAGRLVHVTPFISQLSQGLSGSSSPADMETALQLVYKYLVSPRVDSSALQSLKSRLSAFLQNKENDPAQAFNDTLGTTLLNYHYASRPLTSESLKEIDFQTASRFYKDRFSDPGAMTFVFVGTIDTAKLKPMIETYLGGLPSLKENETWKDMGIKNPAGVIEKTVQKGIEKKSIVGLVFTGHFQWDRHGEYYLESLIDILNIKLRQAVREEQGGTYGVRVMQNISKYPKSKYMVLINFGCSPVRVEELTKTVFSVFDSLKQFGPSETEIAKVKEMNRKQREVNLKVNGFWMRFLSNYLSNGDDPNTLYKYDEFVNDLKSSDIKETAAKYLDEKNYIKVVLYPESQL